MRNKSYIDLLPSDLLSKIFEYDLTYREKFMNDDVEIELWGKSIENWSCHYVIPPNNYSYMGTGWTIEAFDSKPYVKCVMTYLVNKWCIDLHKKKEWNKFYPSDFNVYMRQCYAGQYDICLEYNECRFDGLIFESRECYEANCMEIYDQWKEVSSYGNMILLEYCDDI
jgi:hypothetical protein